MVFRSEVMKIELESMKRVEPESDVARARDNWTLMPDVEYGTGHDDTAIVAALVALAQVGVSTDAQASWWGGKGIGTVPHGLIAACGVK